MDQVKDTMTPNKTVGGNLDGNVAPLREMKAVKLVNAPDFRGWTVKLADGHAIGTVDRLFIDKTGHQLRYFEVKVDAKVAQPIAAQNSALLVPVGRGQLDAKENIVTLPTLTLNNVKDMPKMPSETPSQSFEVVLAKWFGAKTPAENLYAGDVFDLGFLTQKRPSVAETAKK